MVPTTPPVLQNDFVAFMGQLAEMCSFNRSIGQIYGVLYLASEPLSLEDIAKACRMSKGNASIHVRTLEHWGAVHPAGKSGTRKDYYTANTDLRGLAIKRLQEGAVRRIELVKQKIDDFRKDPAFSENLRTPEGQLRMARLQELENLLKQVESAYALFPKLAVFKRLFGK